MRLSPETINVFKNFAQISPGILISPGNKIKIMGANKVLAMATIPETFEEQVALYDLPQFLNMLTMFENPTLEFNGRYAMIRQGPSVVKFTYADPMGIVKCPDEVKAPPTIESFVIQSDVLKALKKAAGIMGLPHISIKGDGSTVQLIASDREKSSSNNYVVDIADTGRTFEAVFTIDQFVQLDFGYAVDVTPGPTRFKATVPQGHAIETLDYWMPPQPKYSKLNG